MTLELEEKDSFRTLRGFGLFIAALGWVVVVFGFLFIFGGGDMGEAVPLAVGIPLTIGGFVTVAFGQLIRCVVAIERNTRVAALAITKRDAPAAPKEW